LLKVIANMTEGKPADEDFFQDLKSYYSFVLSVLRKVGGVEDFEKMENDCPDWQDLDEIPNYQHFKDGFFVEVGAKAKMKGNGSKFMIKYKEDNPAYYIFKPQHPNQLDKDGCQPKKKRKR